MTNSVSDPCTVYNDVDLLPSTAPIVLLTIMFQSQRVGNHYILVRVIHNMKLQCIFGGFLDTFTNAPNCFVIPALFKEEHGLSRVPGSTCSSAQSARSCCQTPAHVLTNTCTVLYRILILL